MASIHTSHRKVFLVPASLYLVLVAICAVLPAMQAAEEEQQVEVPYVGPLAAWGRELYRESFNCVVCHTQQIRGDERRRSEIDGKVPVLAADARFGLEGPTTAEEYAHQVAPMFGTQRTGPDLMSVGIRMPSRQWHYWHLYDPRSVSPDSTMEAYPYLFTIDKPAAENDTEPEEVLSIQELGFPPGTKLWATPRAVALVEYLLSLTRPTPILKKDAK